MLHRKSISSLCFLLLGVFMALSSPAFALGERPKPNAKKSVEPAKKIEPTVISPITPSVDPVEIVSENVTKPLGEEELLDLEKAYKDALSQRQFLDALALLEKIPTAQLTSLRKSEYEKLSILRQAELDASKTNSLFQKEDDTDEVTKKTIQKLYREAQWEYLQNKTELSRDLLIQILFLDRRNSKARKLLESALQLKVGDYKVEDIEEKYWNKSSVSFYGGNYASAVESLNILIFFDKENPLIYERMGSSYYMMGEKRKAVDAWNTALFFKPGNSALQEIVDKAKKVIAEEDEESRQRAKNKKKTETAQVSDGELQLMGLYKTQNEAYGFAAELKKRGLVPIVEEQDTGKWAVKVPKSQLQKK